MNTQYGFIQYGVLAASIALTACGGGGGGGSNNNNTSPTTPVPATTSVGEVFGASTSATVGSSGGSVQTADQKITVSIPASALTTDTQITIQPITNNAHGNVGMGYRLLPEGVTFSQPVEVTFSYEESDISGSAEEALGVAFQTADGHWQWVSDPVVDTTNNTVTITTTHFSDWSLVKGFQITPAEKNVLTNQTVSLSVVYCYTPVSGDNDLVPLGYDCDSSDDELVPLLPTANVSNWSVNGIGGGNNTVGVVSGSGVNATYYAPSSAPNSNPVAVSAQIVMGSGTTLAVANINVVDTESYTGEILFGINECSGFTCMQIDGTIDVIFTLADVVGDARYYDATGSLTATFAPQGCVAQQATLPLDISPVQGSGYGLTVIGSQTPMFANTHYWTLSAGVVSAIPMNFNCDNDPDLETELLLQVFIGTIACDADVTASPYDDVTHLHGTYHCTGDGMGSSLQTDAYWDFVQ